MLFVSRASWSVTRGTPIVKWAFGLVTPGVMYGIGTWTLKIVSWAYQLVPAGTLACEDGASVCEVAFRMVPCFDTRAYGFQVFFCIVIESGVGVWGSLC
jgi:hypothetical protein